MTGGAQTSDDLNFFGANSRVVVAISEIDRIATNLQVLTSIFEIAQTSILERATLDLLGASWVPSALNSLQQLQSRSESLQLRCLHASASYLDAESATMQAIAVVADRLPVGDQVRMLWVSGWLGASLGGVGTHLGASSLRLLAHTAIPNAGSFDLPILANRASGVMQATGIVLTPENARFASITQTTAGCAGSVSELSERLLELSELGEPTLRIDALQRHSGPGRLFVLYLPGTQIWGLGSSNPLDMQSNVLAMAAPRIAASEVAARAAISKLNLIPDDRIVFVGHSQGGLVAKNLVRDFAPQTQGVVTFGAPVVAADFGSIPALHFRHMNDPVVALGGIQSTYPKQGMQISREFNGDTAFASHALESYRETAELSEGSRNPDYLKLSGRVLGELAVSSGKSCESWNFALRRTRRN